MRPEVAISFVVAAICHALLLFCIHLRAAAKPLDMSDAGSPVQVTLVQPAVETPSAPPEVAPAPEPSPQITPPVPEATPEPVPEITPPAPTPEPESTPVPVKQQEMSTPAPSPVHHEKPRAHAATSTSARRTAAASQTSNAPAPGMTTAGGSSSSSRPGYRNNPRPDYPPEARAAHQEGIVMLAVHVSAEGRTTDVSLSRSSGYPLLDKSAMEAVRRWTFDPAREGGFPVESRVEIPVRFTLRDAYR